MSNNINSEKQVRELTDAYKALTAEVRQAVDVFQNYKKTQQNLPSDYLNSLQKLKEVQEQYNKAIADANGKQAEYTAQKKEEDRINKQLLQVDAKIAKATSKESKELAKKRAELTIINKQQKQQAQLSSKLVGAYTKESIRLNILRQKYKDVAIEKGESSRQAKNLAKEVKRLDAKLKRVDATVGQFQRNIGNYPKQLGNAARAMRNFASAFGFTSAVFILAQTVRNAVKVFNEFDQSQADLAAILGRSRDGISELTAQAKELGATTAFTATQVAELQLELAKLGFTDNQILDATQGIENLAIATGVDAARAAKLGGAALRGFALDASEANRVAATLAVSTTKSASTFESLEVALPKVSAIAKSFGFTIEDTTALLGGLQNAGFESSIAGTSLRQIFLQLADSNGKLAKRLGGGAKNFDELIDQFKKAEAEGISLSEAFNLTNARSVAAFKTFLAGAEDLRTLRDSITDVQDELDVLAEQKLDSIQGRITLLNSAWQGWILSLDESGEAAESVKNALDFLTKNLDKILNTLIKVAKALLIYKTIMIATTLATRAYVATTTALRIAKIALVGGIGKATLALKAFNLAAKTSPIGLLLSVISGAVAIFSSFSFGLGSATEEVENFNDELERAETRASEFSRKLKEMSLDDQEQQVISSRFEIEDRTAAGLRKTGFDDEIQIKEVLKLVRKERSKNIDQLNYQIALLGVFSEQQTEFIRKQIFDMQAVNAEQRRIDAEREAKANEQQKENEKRSKQLQKDIFQLERSRLKRAIEIANEIQKNEENSIEERLTANQVFLDKSRELVDLEAKFAISQAKGRKNKITQIQEEQEHNLTKATKKGNKERDAITASSFKKRLLDFTKRQEAEQRQLDNATMDYKRSLMEQGLSAEEIEKKVTKRRREEREKQLQDQIDFAMKELQVLAITAEEKADIEKKLAKLKKELLDLEFNKKKTNEEEFLEKQQEIADQRLEIEQQLAENIKQLALAVSDAIFQVQLNRLDDEEKRAEEKADKALQFANGNAEAEAEIERQLQEKKDAIEEKRIETEKRAFLFNQAFAVSEIAIDTIKQVAAIKAQAALLLSNPATAPLASVALSQIPLVITSGAIAGAAVLAQSIPALKEGATNFEGGLALINDQKGSNYQEYVRTPDGKMTKYKDRNVLVNLPKGTDVLTAKESTDFDNELNQMLDFNGILTSKQSYQNIEIINKGGISSEEYQRGVKDIVKTIKEKPTHQTNIDRKGVEVFVKRQNARSKLLNNKINIRN